MLNHFPTLTTSLLHSRGAQAVSFILCCSQYSISRIRHKMVTWCCTIKWVWPTLSHDWMWVVTDIGAVVTAVTGVKIFWPSFLLLDRIANGALTVWPHTLNTNCLLFLMLMAIKMQPSWPHYRVWKLSLTAWPTPKTALDPLTASWPWSQLWLRRLWEWSPLGICVYITSWRTGNRMLMLVSSVARHKS